MHHPTVSPLTYYDCQFVFLIYYFFIILFIIENLKLFEHFSKLFKEQDGTFFSQTFFFFLPLKTHYEGTKVFSVDLLLFSYRMNKAMTFGFENHVGNKTTHHIMYPESAVDLAAGVNLVLLPFKLRDLEWVSSALSTGEIKM